MTIESDIYDLKESVKYLLEREKERQEGIVYQYHNNILRSASTFY